MFGKMQNAMFGSGKQSGPDMGMGPPVSYTHLTLPTKA